MKNYLTIALVIIAIAMIFIGVTAKILPPALTGIGFIIIAILFYDKKK
ncbi:MAG: hypothetical protein IBX66_00300 [Lutibacter sp.]|nr:hypothetical protein [Lutibacter sp.]